MHFAIEQFSSKRLVNNEHRSDIELTYTTMRVEKHLSVCFAVKVTKTLQKLLFISIESLASFVYHFTVYHGHSICTRIRIVYTNVQPPVL